VLLPFRQIKLADRDRRHC